MYFIYVVSNPRGKIYIGQTDNLARRLAVHNSEKFAGYTARLKGPWHLIYSESHATRNEAMEREKHLKQGAGHRWLKELIDNRPRGVA